MSRRPKVSKSFCQGLPRFPTNFPLPKLLRGQTWDELESNFFYACLENGVHISGPVIPDLTPAQLTLVSAAFDKLQHEHMPRERQLRDEEEEAFVGQEAESEEVSAALEELIAWELEQCPKFSEALCLCRATSTKYERSAYGKEPVEVIWGMSKQAIGQYRAATERKCLELLETQGRSAALAHFRDRLKAALDRRNERLAPQRPQQLNLWGDA